MPQQKNGECGENPVRRDGHDGDGVGEYSLDFAVIAFTIHCRGPILPVIAASQPSTFQAEEEGKDRENVGKE